MSCSSLWMVPVNSQSSSWRSPYPNTESMVSSMIEVGISVSQLLIPVFNPTWKPHHDIMTPWIYGTHWELSFCFPSVLARVQSHTENSIGAPITLLNCGSWWVSNLNLATECKHHKWIISHSDFQIPMGNFSLLTSLLLLFYFRRNSAALQSGLWPAIGLRNIAC